MPVALDELLALMDLEELEVDLFRGRSPQEGSQRVFGGQVLGQALVAGGRSVPPRPQREPALRSAAPRCAAASQPCRPAHSFHAYFLRPGDPAAPILYQVDRTRDGRSFTTRRVTAVQRGRAIFQLEASFHAPERGPAHQEEMPDAPDPESLPSWQERVRPIAARAPASLAPWLLRERPIETRHVTWFDPIEPEKLPPRLLVWIRAAGPLPDSLLLHQCVLAYASDMTLLDAVALPHQIAWTDESWQIASLDHAMWFHRAFRADEWLLYAQESPIASGGRGFATGKLFAREGTLVASVVQEGLLRPLRPV
jgi:acyl-CoA thioesterase-2